MKKVLSIFLVVVMLCSTFAGLQITSAAANLPSSGYCGVKVTYTFDSATGLLTISGSGAMTNYSSSSESPFYYQTGIKTVVINSGVTSIGNSAFYDCRRLTSITIPDSVTRIGNSAFFGCSGLTSITIPDSVTSIGNFAFCDCYRLTSVNISSIEAWCKISFVGEYSNPLYFAHNLYLNNELITDLAIPNSVTSIGNSAFCDCSGLTSVTIGNSVTSIGDSAFRGCSGLTSITIPNSVTSIGDSALRGCSGLTSITIPDSVKSIGSSAFENCSGLTSITIPDSVKSIGNSAFFGCIGFIIIYRSTQEKWNSIYKASDNAELSKAQKLYCPPNKQGNCGDNVTYSYTCNNNIGVLTISGTGKMTDYDYTSASDSPFYNLCVDYLIIKNGVTRIGNYSFYGSAAIKSITIPDSVTSIGSSAFYGCSALTSITIPDSVKSIGSSAFRGCSGLTSITIPDSVTSIGSSAFENCSGLTSITIPDSVTSIGNYAFYDCRRLTSITIPDSVTSIGSFAFYGCSGLTSVTIPSFVKSIGSSAFENCSGLTSITIPDSVTSIGNSAFSGCSGLTSIIIPDSVTSIGYSAFKDCSGLTSITIPNSVTSIGNSAFSGCSRLTSITIPDFVTSIGNSAFSGCSRLTSITIPDSVTSIGSYTFYGCSGLKELTMPCSTKIYNSSDTFYSCTNIEKVTLTKGTGTMQNYGTYTSSSATDTYYGYSPWYTSCNNLKEVVLEEGITNIGSYAFYGCSELRSINIPNSVTSISGSAFEDCSGLTSITIPNSVTSIGAGVFKNCTGIQNTYLCSKQLDSTQSLVSSLPAGSNLHAFPSTDARIYCDIYSVNFVELEEPRCDEGIHTFVETIVIEPNCVDEGLKKFSCLFCEETKNEVIPALNHNYTEEVIAPTCIEKGYTKHTCSRCADSYVDNYVNAAGHQSTEAVKENEVAATCTQNGFYDEVIYCSVCKAEISRSTITSNAFGHDYKVSITKPTATALGYTEQKCSRCGDSYIGAYTAPTGKQTLKCKARTAIAQTVTWNNVNTATGYQVQISTKDGKKWSTYVTLKAGVTNYTFKSLVAGNNYKFRVRFYINASDGKNYFSPWSSTLTSPTLPTGTALTKLTPAKKAFTAQWKKNATVNGYQVQYSLKANFAGAKTITVKNPKSLKATAAKLYAGKYYYVRIRTYKTIAKANYFSAWSKTYKVKTK